MEEDSVARNIAARKRGCNSHLLQRRAIKTSQRTQRGAKKRGHDFPLNWVLRTLVALCIGCVYIFTNNFCSWLQVSKRAGRQRCINSVHAGWVLMMARRLMLCCKINPIKCADGNGLFVSPPAHIIMMMTLHPLARVSLSCLDLLLWNSRSFCLMASKTRTKAYYTLSTRKMSKIAYSTEL